jgi:hypothetical protein
MANIKKITGREFSFSACFYNLFAAAIYQLIDFLNFSTLSLREI